MPREQPSEPITLNTGELLFWVTELQAGRPDAAEQTLQKIIKRVEKLAKSMFRKYPRVGRFVSLDDVVQNAMIRLLRALRTIRPESTRHFYALSSEMIRRELLDLVKHFFSQRGPGEKLTEVCVGDAPGEHAPLAPSTDEELDRWTEFHHIVERLPIEQREVFGLVYYHGWKTEGISNTFGVSKRTVQRWLAEAIESLQDRMPADLEP